MGKNRKITNANIIIGKKSILARKIFKENKKNIFISYYEIGKYLENQENIKSIFFFIGGNFKRNKKLNYRFNYIIPKKIVSRIKNKNIKIYIFGTQNEYYKYPNIKDNYYGNSRNELKKFMYKNYKNFIWFVTPLIISFNAKKGFFKYIFYKIKKIEKVVIHSPNNKIKIVSLNDFIKFINQIKNDNKHKYIKEFLPPSSKILSVKYIIKKIFHGYQYKNFIFKNLEKPAQKILPFNKKIKKSITKKYI